MSARARAPLDRRMTAGMREWLERDAFAAAQRRIRAGIEVHAVPQGERVALLLDGKLFEPRRHRGEVQLAQVSRKAAERLLQQLTMILSEEAEKP